MLGKSRDKKCEKKWYNNIVKIWFHILSFLSEWAWGIPHALFVCKKREKGQAITGVVIILTPKQEQYCRNRAILRMSQRKAYIDAYPKAKEWQPTTVDARACELEAQSNILVRLKELRDEQTAIMTQEATWTRQDAYDTLKNLITAATEEMDIAD